MNEVKDPPQPEVKTPAPVTSNPQPASNPKKFILIVAGGLILIIIIVLFIIASRDNRQANPQTSNQTPETSSPQTQPLEPPPPANEGNNQGSHNFYGDENSEIVLIEAFNFACSSCASYHPTMKALREEYKDHFKFQVIHYASKNNPTSVFAKGFAAHQAAEAAAQQGQDEFWAMHDKLFETREAWISLEDPSPHFKMLGEDIGLDIFQFENDYVATEISDILKRDYDYLTKEFKVNATPSFILNTEVIPQQPGSQDIEAWRTVLNEVLAEPKVNNPIEVNAPVSSQPSPGNSVVEPLISDNFVSGTINYDAATPLPETVQLIIQLRDTSKQDVASLLIVQQIISDNLDQPPISFSLEYDPEDILDGHTYSLSIKIRDANDKLLFTNDTAYHVISRGYPKQVDVDLIKI